MIARALAVIAHTCPPAHIIVCDARATTKKEKKMHHATKWCEYLVSGVSPSQSQAIIYHMCDAKSWEEQIAAKGTYTPPTFEKDGFVHATVRAPVVVRALES